MLQYNIIKVYLNRLCGHGLNLFFGKMDLWWVIANSIEPLGSIKGGEIFLTS
jgi:hypothetical protein